MILDTNNPIEMVGASVMYGGSLTVVAGAAFLGIKWFAKEWIDSLFKERLQGLNNDFQKQLQELKSEQEEVLKHVQKSIDHQIHRAKRLYDTEFDVLTKAWLMLEELYGYGLDTIFMLAPLHDWDEHTRAAIHEALDEIAPDFTEAQKKRVAEADDSPEEYRRVFYENKIERNESASTAFGHYLGTHGIFMRPEIRDRFKKMSIFLLLTFGEYPHAIRKPDLPREHLMRLQTEGAEIRKELDSLITGRLWSAADPVRS